MVLDCGVAWRRYFLLSLGLFLRARGDVVWPSTKGSGLGIPSWLKGNIELPAMALCTGRGAKVPCIVWIVGLGPGRAACALPVILPGFHQSFVSTFVGLSMTRIVGLLFFCLFFGLCIFPIGFAQNWQSLGLWSRKCGQKAGGQETKLGRYGTGSWRSS